MLPTVERGGAVQVSRGPEVSPERVPSHLTEDPALWSRRHISALPNEVLSHIFNYLGCDDIAQVNDTCQQFRWVVRALHWEALLFSQLPMLMRKQHLQSQSLQKQMVQDGLHPFITEPSNRERDVSNAEQQAAVACFHLQKSMISTSRYRLTEVFFERFSGFFNEYFYTPGSSTILFYYRYDSKLSLLGQNDSGSWSVQSLDLAIQGRRTRALAGVSISSNKRYLSVFAYKQIQIYQFDGGSWQFNKLQPIRNGHRFVISPSRQFLTVYNKTDSIESIRCFDETARWKCMPMPRCNKKDLAGEAHEFSPSEQHIAIWYKKKLEILSVNCRGGWNVSWEAPWNMNAGYFCLRFSPSEKQVAISYEKKVVILSLNSGGSWNVSWESPSNRKTYYTKFCPSGSWLLIGFFCSVDIIRLDTTGKCTSQQQISSRKLSLTFSPGGKHVVSEGWEAHYLLWRLLESGQWACFGDLNGPGFGLTNMRSMKFSSCENYLFTSTSDGVVKIWGWDGQGSWMVLSSEQYDDERKVRLSQSGTNALVVGPESISIWGRDGNGLWAVKGSIPVSRALKLKVHFHPMAEHLIVVRSSFYIRIVEIRPALEPEGR